MTSRRPFCAPFRATSTMPVQRSRMVSRVVCEDAPEKLSAKKMNASALRYDIGMTCGERESWGRLMVGRLWLGSPYWPSATAHCAIFRL